MIEYLFFNRSICLKFLDVLKHKGVDWQEEIEAVQDAISIKVSEDIGDELWDELDEIYDTLSVEDQMLLEQQVEDENLQAAAGIYLQLADGKQTIAKVNPQTMNRILEAISMDEFNEFLEVIVSSVENPDDSPICKTE